MSGSSSYQTTTSKFHQGKTSKADVLESVSVSSVEGTGDAFYREWPMKLHIVAGFMQNKQEALKEIFNARETAEINKFFPEWDKFGKQIETKWCDVTNGVAYSSMLGRGGGVGGTSQLTPGKGHVRGDAVTSSTSNAMKVPADVAKELAKIDIDKMTKQFEKLDRDVKDKDRQLEEMTDTNIRITDQLAALMNKTMSMDESNIESISTANRPLKLADDYKEFCSGRWMKAKEALDQKKGYMSEKEKCSLLNRILWVSYDKMNSMLKDLKQTLLDVLNDPFKVGGNGQGMMLHKVRRDVKVNLPSDFEVAVSNYLKTQSIDYTFPREVTYVLAECTKNWRQGQQSLDQLLSSKRLQNYCVRACELSWLMLIQRPPMTFDMSSAVGYAHNPQEQELAFGSEDPSKPRTKALYYVHPAIYHGEHTGKGRLLVKGTVFNGIETGYPMK